MKFSTATVSDVGEGVRGFEVETNEGPDLVETLKKARGETHDRIVAQCLGAASAWAYSDADTFARAMHRRGGIPYNETVSVRITNNALLVDTEAFVCQSKDKNLVILAFGGTNPVNLIQLLLDVTPRRDQFWTVGRVHGSFFRSALALWPTLKKLLSFAIGGSSLCSGAESERGRTREECKPSRGKARVNGSRNEAHDSQDDLCEPSSAHSEEPKTTLYLTGHSLGGALALLTAAIMYLDPDAAPLWESVRAIYTYGQPMVGCSDFAEKFEDILGRKLYRHIYRDDFVPTMPSRTAGQFQHIGAELCSTENGWLPQVTYVKQAPSFVTSFASGIVNFFAEQVPDVHTLPFLSRLQPFQRVLQCLKPLVPTTPLFDYFPQVSLYDHLPVNYLRTSMILPPGTEFL
ncbi:lipase family protein [Sorangium sp. So ce854]|uniref:lipase family protein n=1 Tax=Sorangium sp. So ce854 TaxID=3133322 RepID=UPI003F6029EF